MKVLITGGLGNLGLWLTHYFLDLGHDVAVLGRNERVVIKHQNYRYLCADITDLNSLASSISCYYDFCIHTASINEASKISYTEDALHINALGTEYLCRTLLFHGVGKIIYLSTFHVYGMHEGIITEETLISPDNDYALTHFFAEKYIEKNAKRYGLNYIIFRLTNSYGCPKDINSDKWYLVLNDLCRQAYYNKNIRLMGNGKALRDFIWMGDVAKIIEASLKKSDIKNSIFNLSSGKSLSVFAVAQCVRNIYFKMYQETVPIFVNSEDNHAPEPLYVSNEKLLQKIKYVFGDFLEIEIQKILQMLGEIK